VGCAPGWTEKAGGDKCEVAGSGSRGGGDTARATDIMKTIFSFFFFLGNDMKCSQNSQKRKKGRRDEQHNETITCRIIDKYPNLAQQSKLEKVPPYQL
jgi:hypothetical protein